MPPLRAGDSVEVLARVKASLAALAAGAALTRAPHFTPRAFIEAAGDLEEGRNTMNERSLTPNITVTIGHHTRIYCAFVTTAPTELDSPATVTLHAATFADVAGFAAEPSTARRDPGRGTARLVLVDAMELAWQRAALSRAISTCCCPQIPGSSASTRCSSGCGNGFRPRNRPGRSVTRANRSSASTARRKGELFRRSHHGRQNRSERQRQPARQTRRMPSCTSPTACSTA